MLRLKNMGGISIFSRLQHIRTTHSKRREFPERKESMRCECAGRMFPVCMLGNESRRFTRALLGPYQSRCTERSESGLRTYSEFLVPTG